MKDFLSGCVYYPAAGVDGTPVRWLSKRWDRFVYVDAMRDRAGTVPPMLSQAFAGYVVNAQREVTWPELVPTGWRPNPPACLTRDTYLPYLERSIDRAPGWACLSTMDRLPTRTPEHGPERFELLQIQAEGVAAYQALFNSNRTLPDVIVYARAGEGFGFNYSNFIEAWLEVMLDHPDGLPPFLFCWHPKDDPGMSEPWDKYYGPLVMGPFPKDSGEYSDEGWGLSLFSRL